MAIETDYPSLARELGLTRRQREDIKASGLVKTRTVRQRTQISDEDAKLLRDAARVALIAGVAVIVVLRLLSSGAVVPNIPD